MKAGVLLGLALGLAASAAATVFAVRVVRHFHGARVEVGEFKTTQVEPATRARLASLKDKLFVTYFVSTRDDMPSHMRGLEHEVHNLLSAMKDASGGMFDFAIVDPKTTPDLERYASNRRISPVRVRSVSRDSYSEKTVWSGISVAYSSYKPAVINGIEPATVPRLQSLIMGHLDQMEHPRRPVVAFATPSAASSPPGLKATYKEALAELRKRVEGVDPNDRARATPGKVLEVDLNAGAPIPMEADLLIWVDPVTFTPSRLRELNLYLESGRSAVIAAGEQTIEYVTGAAGTPAVAIKPTGYDAAPLLAEFGLQPVRGLVLDGNCADLLVGDGKVAAPFLLRCIGYNQDFRRMRGQPNGTLLFVAPTPMQLDSEKLAENGWTADLLATTSDKTWVMEVPKDPVPLPAPAAPKPEPPPKPDALGNPAPQPKIVESTPIPGFAVEKGEGLPKQPVIVGLVANDPWRGEVVICGTGSVFEDGNYDRKDTAHWRLLKTLVDSLASDERVVQAKIGIRRPAAVPELVPGQRFLWRFVCVFLLPAVLFGIAFGRGAFRGHGAEVKIQRDGGWRLKLAVSGLAGVIAVGLLASGASALGARLDLTGERVNALTPQTLAIAKSVQGGAAVQADILFSSHDRLPPALRPEAGELARTLREIRRAGADLAVHWIEPEDLAPAQRAELEKVGVTPVKVSTREEEATVVRNVYCHLRLRRGDRSEILRFPEVASFEALEFKVAFALWRLVNGRSPHVVFVSDSPRLSPAEDWDYTQAGLNPPKGNDVYSVAREVVRELGYKVSHVNPRDAKPTLPADTDLMIWFQPRRDCCAMMEEMVRYLHRGGHVALFAQHFVFQSRQYPGRNFDMVYWPQPQFPDIDDLYYPDIGIKATREVLFDDLKTRIALDSQVHRGAQKELKPMESALPFLIRASAANYAKDSPITRNLGDQAFLFASFLELDEARLAELGIRAKAVMTTSERSWTMDWRGGWIPQSFLVWPPAPSHEEGKLVADPRLLPHAALAILFEGTFPLPAAPLSIQPLAMAASGPASQSKPAITKDTADPGVPGQFLFVGCSEAFKNYRLAEKEFRADQFLTNVVAALALPEAVGSVATRRPVARGFGIVDPSTMVGWRVLVQAGLPLALLGFGIGWTLSRRRGAVKGA